jgi:amino acid transporter
MATSTDSTDTRAPALGKRTLGVPALVFMIIAASAPLTVVAGGVTTDFAVSGVLGVPLSFVVLGIILLVFAVGYTAMSRHVRNAGAFYAYVARGLGKPTGIGAAWVALVSYNAMQIGIYGLFGFALSSFLTVTFGLAAPWWLCALIGWAIVGILGVNRVDFSAKVLGIIVACEFLVVMVYDLLSLKVAPEGISTESLQPASLFTAGVGAALAFSIAGFMGFESGAIYSEEVKDPKTTPRRATLIAIGIIAVFYAFSGWAMAVGEGHSAVIGAAAESGPELVFVFLADHAPAWFVEVGRLLFITSLLAALIAFHNVVARYLFSLGREGVLPAALAKTNARSHSPVAGSLTQSALALVVLLVFAFVGAGQGEMFPVVTLFTWLTNTGAFGLVMLMALTSFAVIGYFRSEPHGMGKWTTRVAPLTAGIALVVLFGAIVANFDVLIGLEDASVLGWLLPALVVVPGILGLLWAFKLRSSRPAIYAGVGHGGDLAEAEDNVQP